MERKFLYCEQRLPSFTFISPLFQTMQPVGPEACGGGILQCRMATVVGPRTAKRTLVCRPHSSAEATHRSPGYSQFGHPSPPPPPKPPLQSPFPPGPVRPPPSSSPHFSAHPSQAATHRPAGTARRQGPVEGRTGPPPAA